MTYNYITNNKELNEYITYVFDLAEQLAFKAGEQPMSDGQLLDLVMDATLDLTLEDREKMFKGLERRIRYIYHTPLKEPSRTRFICELSDTEQVIIRQALEDKHLNDKQIREAMSSRLCDLEDTIDLNDINLNKLKSKGEC